MSDAHGVPLARRVQGALERLYGVEAPPIEDFVRVASGERESVLVRRRGGALEIRVVLPPEAMSEEGGVSLDRYAQIVEGVSHFIKLVERARRALPTTQLELELQAEVDKYVLFSRLMPAQRARASLYDDVHFLHDRDTVLGERYRLASSLAARFVTRLMVARGSTKQREVDTPLAVLRRFFGAGQREKLEMVMAA